MQDIVHLMVAALVLAAASLEDARTQVSGVGDALEEATVLYEEVQARTELAVELQEAFDGRAAELQDEVALMERALQDRARMAYMRGSGQSIEIALVVAWGPAPLDRIPAIALLQRGDIVTVQALEAARTSLGQARARADDEAVRVAGLTAELEARRRDLEAELEAAERRVAHLEAEAAARAAARAATRAARGKYACPLGRDVMHFVDSWGWPRSGGRTHKGTDIMGPMGSPVYAFTSGVISRHSHSRLGGTSLYLAGDDGYTYFYAHLQAYTTKGAVGTRVQAGTQIATNGNTGNARGGAPHVHFERHKGGAASNPYSALAAACF